MTEVLIDVFQWVIAVPAAGLLLLAGAVIARIW